MTYLYYDELKVVRRFGITRMREEEIMYRMTNYLLITTIMLLCLPLYVTAQWLETTITVGDSPSALVYDSIRNIVYCANYYSENVSVIDGATNTVTKTVEIGGRPITLAFNPTSNKVYSANFVPPGNGNMTVIDCTTDTVITTFPVGNWPRS